MYQEFNEIYLKYKKFLPQKLAFIDPGTDDIAIYAGTLEKYMNPCDTMKNYKKEVDNMEVVKSSVNCGNQLFIIVKGGK